VISISMTLQGGTELQAALDRLEKQTGNKIVREALRDSQKIMQQSAKTRANYVIGGDMGKRIAKALQVRAGKRRIKGSYIFGVSLKKDDAFIHKTKSRTVRHKDAAGNIKRVYGSYYIPAAIEYGHVTKAGKFVQPLSYLRSADKSTKEIRIENFSKKVKQGIEELGKAK
jgi:hypothetical protein